MNTQTEQRGHSETAEQRIVIITGANSGVGRAAAMQFAAEGHTVIMACRSRERAEPVQREIVEATGNRDVSVMEVDMSSRDSIRTFAAEFQTRNPRVDVLIHNAAYLSHGDTWQLSPDGMEIAFATNVAGPFLLTHLLLDSLQRSKDPRILHAGSNIIKHFFNPKKEFDLSTLRSEPEDRRPTSVYHRYRRSKMALLMLTFIMARKLESRGITVNCLEINGARMSPETLGKMTLPYRMIGRIQNLFFRPPEYMAENYVQITTSDRFRGVTGCNFNDKREAMKPGSSNGTTATQQLRNVFGRDFYPELADDEATQEAVWDACLEATGPRK
jgi:NAD(P)-dependent dehydrogenase (short-subunit alcohol dehydrogenase family)